VDCPMIMVAHLHCTCFDKEEIPTSLSKNALTYLRKNLNYQGLIITDDMVMGGVLGSVTGDKKQETGDTSQSTLHSSRACVQAIKAGVNILLYRNSDDETIKIIKNLARLAKTDGQLRHNIETSYEKIISFKQNFFHGKI